MKKIILLLLITTFCYSQDVTTTIDEYNYMIKGYYISQSSGLDVKQGYKVVDFVKHDYDLYSFDYKELIRVSDGKCVGILVNAKSKAWGNVYHYAIPFGNQDLLQNYVFDLSKLDKSMLDSYNTSSSLLLAVFASSYYND